ncbi:histidine kinase dimerization/phospho-acceptor domain-containing protein [Mucilaginibacter ginkgonis]|uniref:histidine kinase n=1 Tax=Mucilaginibacter ginkgonis TaxID=2682091 RepID=A0A6I4HYY6_9SPHI|nr:histidine kinase dimerization/phospho-acceptor domain-containing protein [Mucilaginibacter ginkgonis]QQL50188.1 hypothetical protein GO620_001680 [Mucilaginibacter ginkgonis]
MTLPDNFLHIAEFLKSSNTFYTIAIGMDSTYGYVSKSYDVNFSTTSNTLAGQHFSVTLHPDDIAICEKGGAACFNDPDKLISVTLRKHDGRGGYIVTQWDMQAMFDKDGSPLGIFCLGYNITDFVESQDNLKDANLKLDEIHYIQSHEVRKPLANIMGLTEMLLSTNEPQDTATILPKLAQATKELDAIVHRLSN